MNQETKTELKLVHIQYETSGGNVRKTTPVAFYKKHSYCSTYMELTGKKRFFWIEDRNHELTVSTPNGNGRKLGTYIGYINA